jgi:hypothetical protein
MKRTSRKHPPAATFAIALAILLACLAAALAIVPTSAGRPWDFQTYRLAATAAVLGFDPYSQEDLARLAGRPVGMPFLYSPVTVWLFSPFALARVWPGAAVWAGLKVLALTGMVVLWRRRFLPGVPLAPLCICVAFAFNASAVWDLTTGNVAIVEQLLLWLALAAFVEGRAAPCAGAVVAGSLFKVTPGVFLGLLVLPVRGRAASWRLLPAGALALAALAFGPTLLGLDWAQGYLRNLPADRPWGYANPSALGLIDTITGVNRGAAAPGTSWRNVLLWAGFAAVVLALGVRWVRHLWRTRDAALWAMTAALAYPLLHPRPMSYGYLLAVPAVLALLPPCLRLRGRLGFGAIALGLALPWLLIPALRLDYSNPLVANAPFFMLLLCWCVVAVRGPASLPASSPAAPPPPRGAQDRPAKRAPVP